MDSLEVRLRRLCQFADHLPAQAVAGAAVKETVLIIERLVADYPEARDNLRDCLPRLAELAGDPQN